MSSNLSKAPSQADKNNGLIAVHKPHGGSTLVTVGYCQNDDGLDQLQTMRLPKVAIGWQGVPHMIMDICVKLFWIYDIIWRSYGCQKINSTNHSTYSRLKICNTYLWRVMLVKPYCIPAIPVDVVMTTFLFFLATSSVLMCFATVVFPVPACKQIVSINSVSCFDNCNSAIIHDFIITQTRPKHPQTDSLWHCHYEGLH